MRSLKWAAFGSYIDRKGFPAPAAALACGRIWEREAVEKWATATGRLKDGGG